jgi:large subunit ribosomal protein L7/L12
VRRGAARRAPRKVKHIERRGEFGLRAPAGRALKEEERCGGDKMDSTKKTVEKTTVAAATAESAGAATESRSDEVLSLLKGMTLIEVNDLVKKLEEEFGVTAAMSMMSAAAPQAAAGDAPAAEEEQTEFDVVLNAIGDKKIQVIKVVRAVTALGLKEAKALVDSSPKVVKEKVSRKEADEVKAQLDEVGAQVEIK